MIKIKIDKHIPIPSGIRWGKYPFNEMKVGNSFFVKKPPNLLSSNSHQWKIKHNKRRWLFIVRKEKDGARIWRIK